MGLKVVPPRCYMMYPHHEIETVEREESHPRLRPFVELDGSETCSRCSTNATPAQVQRPSSESMTVDVTLADDAGIVVG